jgi:hypothetical protein
MSTEEHDMPAAESHRPRRCRIRRAGVAAALAVVLAGACAVLVATPASAAPPASASVKFWIVAPEQNGHKEFLYQIAQKALGDGNRYREIFALNKGRRQPDGGRLTDPAILDPGWILQLPSDAHGPGVHIGPLPTVTADASSPDAGSARADSARDIAAPQRPAAGGTASAQHGRTSRRMIVGSTISLLAALLLGLLLAQLRRRRMNPDDDPDGDWPEGPTRPARSVTARARVSTAPAWGETGAVAPGAGPGRRADVAAPPGWTAAAPGWHPAPGWAADPEPRRDAPTPPAWQPVTPSVPPPAAADAGPAGPTSRTDGSGRQSAR